MALALQSLAKVADVLSERETPRSRPELRACFDLEETNSMMRKTCKALTICLSVIVAASSAAFAGTTTTTLAVTAIVGSTCNISTSAVAFGSYDPLVVNLANPLNGQGTVSSTCTNGLTNTIELDQGLNQATGSAVEVPLRQMRSGGNVMAYFLYQNSGRTTVFGGDVPTGVGQTGTGGNANLTVFGQVPGGQNVAPCSYADTVTATVAF
jgi:spore coat protein U-like protein